MKVQDIVSFFLKLKTFFSLNIILGVVLLFVNKYTDIFTLQQKEMML